jgi:hypothetical protein
MSSLRSVFGPQARLVWRLALVTALIVIAVLALSGAIASPGTGALTMLPALTLAVVMLARPYLGDRVIARLRARRAQRLDEVRPVAAPALPPTRVARGGRLIAVALAGRAPPLALAGCQ